MVSTTADVSPEHGEQAEPTGCCGLSPATPAGARSSRNRGAPQHAYKGPLHRGINSVGAAEQWVLHPLGYAYMVLPYLERVQS